MRTTFFTIILLVAMNASAQGNERIWAVDFVKTKPGQHENFMKFLEAGWKTSRQALKEKGLVSSFKVLSLPTGGKAECDVLLMTEYPSRQVYEKREEIFNEFFKQREFNVTKEQRDSWRKILFSKEFTSSISSETGEMMLKMQTADAEEAAARIPLENYIKGQETGNGDFIRKAFHKDARIMAFRDGKLLNLSVEEFAGRFNGKAADDEAQRKRTIASLEITGSAAVGKIVLDYPTVKFTDYMSLLKIEGEWKIVNKSFHAEMKAKK